MTESREWNWEAVEREPWLEPCMESYYFARKWQREGRKKLLDLGCGLGRHSVFFAHSGFDVTACDLSETAVRHLLEWQKREKLCFPVRVCDMLSLPFEDSSFDCLWAYHVLSHTDSEGIRRIISELYRVLKSGGAAFFDLCSKETWTYTSSGFPRADDSTVIVQGGEEDGIPHFFTDMDELESLLSDFRIEAIRHIDDCFFDGERRCSKHFFVEIAKP